MRLRLWFAVMYLVLTRCTTGALRCTLCVSVGGFIPTEIICTLSATAAFVVPFPTSTCPTLLPYRNVIFLTPSLFSIIGHRLPLTAPQIFSRRRS